MGDRISIQFEGEYNDLKARHDVAVREMLAAIDRANELKCRIWAIETERLKDEV